jgi:demethylmenaquinone methyltransferase / 2-methoxy-6-polyprenyl-1,4-benzoquinol methylase
MYRNESLCGGFSLNVSVVLSQTMANPFYSPDEERAARVQQLFTGIAQRYDLINDLQSFGLHRRWKRQLVRLAGVRPGSRALDLCCGTGDLALRLATKGAVVTGLDFNQPMLAVAEARKKKSQLSNPGTATFLCGDAQQTPFPDNTYEIITVGYGLRNLVSWESGLREMNRVAKPGGRLLILEFGKPDNALWRWLYFTYLKMFVPLLGWICCGSAAAYAYILESLKHYPAQHGVADKMRELGMQNVRIINLLGGVMSINYGEKAT